MTHNAQTHLTLFINMPLCGEEAVECELRLLHQAPSRLMQGILLKYAKQGKHQLVPHDLRACTLEVRSSSTSCPKET
jgi:hypothetical protein